MAESRSDLESELVDVSRIPISELKDLDLQIVSAALRHVLVTLDRDEGPLDAHNSTI